MGYVIAAILVLLLVAAGVTFFVLNATRGSAARPPPTATRARGTPAAAIVAPDERTPLGDTDQHSGEQAKEARPDGRRRLGRRPARAASAARRRADAGT